MFPYDDHETEQSNSMTFRDGSKCSKIGAGYILKSQLNYIFEMRNPNICSEHILTYGEVQNRKEALEEQ